MSSLTPSNNEYAAMGNSSDRKKQTNAWEHPERLSSEERAKLI